MKNSPYTKMKQILLILAVVALVGCGKSLTEEEKKIVGTYEGMEGLPTGPRTHVFLEVGSFEYYSGGRKGEKCKWKLSGKEIHVTSSSFQDDTSIYKLNQKGGYVKIAWIKDGIRKNYSAEDQQVATWKKIK